MEVFDDRESFKSNDREYYPAEDLKTNDIVIVEAFIRRYTPKDTHAGTKSAKKPAPTLDKWKIAFELNAILLIIKAPVSGPAVVDDADNEEFRDLECPTVMMGVICKSSVNVIVLCYHTSCTSALSTDCC